MLRFSIKLVCLALLIFLMAIGLLIFRMVRAQKVVGSVYTIPPSKCILCIGSSHMGSSIAGSYTQAVHNVHLSSSSVLSYLVRLKEFERRNQLHNIRWLILETEVYAHFEPAKYYRDKESSLWLREFPINWRYGCPYYLPKHSYFEGLGGILFHLRNGFQFSEDYYPENRPLLLSHNAEWREERLNFFWKIHYTDFERRRNFAKKDSDVFKEINDICIRNNIKMVVFSAPLSSIYLASVPAAAWKVHSDFLSRIEEAGIAIFDRSKNYSDEYFFDPTHLAHNGALRFTSELMKFIGME